MKESNDIERLKKIKADMGYTYSKLGKIMGVHWRTVYGWVSGKFKPSFMARERIKKFLKSFNKGGQ